MNDPDVRRQLLRLEQISQLFHGIGPHVQILDQNVKKYRKLAKRAAKVLHISGKRLGNYGNIVCFEPIGKRKLLLVERHLLDIAANLPKVVYRKRYGL